MPVHLGSMDRSVETIIRDNQGRSRPATSTPSTRPITAARICPTSPSARRCSTTKEEAQILFWVASRGHHADVGGISPGSMSPNATTIEQEGVYMDNFKLVDRGRFREKELMAALHRRQISGAQSGAEHQRHEGADRRQRKGRRRAAQDGGAFHAAGGEGLYAARAGQRRGKRAPRDRPAARCGIFLRDGPGHRDQGEDHGRQDKARGHRRFHRHLAAAADQFQRARAGDARRRALRVPRDGGRRHPDECRLPAADQHRDPARIRC